MPVMALVGGKDVLLDSAGTRRRLEQNVSRAEIRYLPEARTPSPRAGHADPRFPEPLGDGKVAPPPRRA